MGWRARPAGVGPTNSTWRPGDRGAMSHPGRRTMDMPPLDETQQPQQPQQHRHPHHPRPARRPHQPAPTHRACSWCATEYVIVRRPGRPRLYCNHACRQRAYEHRHGFEHERTVRPLPGQLPGDVWSGSGYERGGLIALHGKTHALRTSVRPEGPRRETLCGVLARPLTGQYFTPMHPRACQTCTTVADDNPLRIGVSPSNELSRLRSLLDDIDAQRVEPGKALSWIRANSP